MSLLLRRQAHNGRRWRHHRRQSITSIGRSQRPSDETGSCRLIVCYPATMSVIGVDKRRHRGVIGVDKRCHRRCPAASSATSISPFGELGPPRALKLTLRARASSACCHRRCVIGGVIVSSACCSRWVGDVPVSIFPAGVSLLRSPSNRPIDRFDGRLEIAAELSDLTRNGL